MQSIFDTTTETREDADSQTNETRHFPEKVAEYEHHRLTTNMTSIDGPAIKNDARIRVNPSDDFDGVTDRAKSPLLRDYDGWMALKKLTAKNVYSDDRPGLNVYVQEHPEPDIEHLNEFTQEHLGLELVGIEWMDADEAANYGIDYSNEKTWEKFVPVFAETGRWQVPPALSDDPTPEPEPEAEPEPANPTNVTVEDSMSAGDRAAFHKKDHPHLSNEKVGEKFGVSGQAVANACKRNFGEDGYEEIKSEGREARANNGGFEFGVATDGGETQPETDADDLNERAKAAKALIDAGFSPEQATQILGQ